MLRVYKRGSVVGGLRVCATHGPRGTQTPGPGTHDGDHEPQIRNRLAHGMDTGREDPNVGGEIKSFYISHFM